MDGGAVNPTKHREASPVRLFLGILLVLAVCVGFRAWDRPGVITGGAVNDALRTLRSGESDPSSVREALDVLETAALAAPSDPRPWIRWGKQLLRQDQPLKALVALQWARPHRPDSYPLAFELAKAQAASGFIEDAIHTLDVGVFPQRPRHGDALLFRAALAAEQDDLSATLRFFEEGMAAGPTDPTFHRKHAAFDRFRNDDRFQLVTRTLSAPGRNSWVSAVLQ